MRTILLPFAALALMFGTVPAQAVVTYHFAVPVNGSEVGFVWSTPDFVRGTVHVAPESLDSCSAFAGEFCDTQSFITGFGPGGSDVIIFARRMASFIGFASFTYFAPGTFTTVGVHHTEFFDYGATLTVTESAAAVPEPASWAMLVAGFGLTGSVLRRRRNRDAANA